MCLGDEALPIAALQGGPRRVERLADSARGGVPCDGAHTQRPFMAPVLLRVILATVEARGFCPEGE